MLSRFVKTGNVVRPTVRLLIGLQVILVIIVLTAVILEGSRMRSTAIRFDQSHVAAQARNIETQLTQSFNLLRQHLLALPQPVIKGYGLSPSFRVALYSLLDKLVYVRSLSLLDRTGRVLYSTHADNMGVIINTRPFEPVAAQNVSGVLRFDAAWVGRDLADGQPATVQRETDVFDSRFVPVVLTLPINSDMSVVATISSDYFINYKTTFDIVPKLNIQAYLDNGSLMFSSNEEDETVMPLDPSLLQEIQSEFVSEIQGQENGDVAAYRESLIYPWFVRSSVPVEAALKDWRVELMKLYLEAAIFLAVVLAVTGFLTRRVWILLADEEDLHRDAAQAASVFVHSSDGIVITDTKMRIVAVNPAFETITGFTVTEVLGKTPRSLLSSSHTDSFYQDIWGSLAKQGVWQGETLEPHKSGKQLPVMLTINSVPESPGSSNHFYVGVFKDLSGIREREKQIRQLFQAVEQSPFSIVIADLDANIEYANPEFYRLTGYSTDEVIGRNPRLLASGQTPPSTYEHMWATLTSGKVWKGELFNKRKDGSLYTERVTMSPITDAAGAITHYLAIKNDITHEKQVEDQLRLAASVMFNTLDGVLICDAHKKIIDINPAFSVITGYSRDEVLGKSPGILSSGRHDKSFYEAMWTSLEHYGHWRGEFWNRSKDGELYAALSNVSIVRDEKGAISHYINVFADITLLKSQQEKLVLLAHYDPLTHLPNRALLRDRLQIEMARAKREGTWLAVCFMDLDHFKEVNDTLGHEAGDELLVMLARRLETVIREGDTASRLGGDEFVLLLGGLHNEAEYQATANRILKVVEQPFALGEHMARVSGSMGITIYPLDDSGDEQLLRNADYAMYQAKQAGRNRFIVYDPTSDAANRALAEHRTELRRALRNNEFRLYFQPQYNLLRREVVGFEALLRWRHPSRGLLLPEQFLLRSGDADLAAEIDLWVISQAFMQLQHWEVEGVDIALLSINLTAASIGQDDFVEQLKVVMRDFPDLDATRIEFEVLESSAISNLGSVQDTLNGLRRLGFGLALDDFGTGYSSLALLRHLPITKLKIDQSFVRNMFINRNDLSIVESVIRLARAFRLNLVAEGVETLAHGETLLSLGCEVVQGFSVSEPMAANAVALWLRHFVFSPEQHLAQLQNEHKGASPSLVAAAMQHRLWLNALEQFLIDASLDDEHLAALSEDKCMFSGWLQWADRQPDIVRQGVFASVKQQHSEIHNLGRRLVQVRLAGDRDHANQLMEELYAVQSRFLYDLSSIDMAESLDVF